MSRFKMVMGMEKGGDAVISPRRALLHQFNSAKHSQITRDMRDRRVGHTASRGILVTLSAATEGPEIADVDDRPLSLLNCEPTVDFEQCPRKQTKTDCPTLMSGRASSTGPPSRPATMASSVSLASGSATAEDDIHL